MAWGGLSQSWGASSPTLLAQNWGCDQGPLTAQQQLHQPVMNTNEWQWAGFQLYLENTDFWGQCRVLHQKPSIGILDLSSPLQCQGIDTTFLAIHPHLCKFSPLIFNIDNFQKNWQLCFSRSLDGQSAEYNIHHARTYGIAAYTSTILNLESTKLPQFECMLKPEPNTFQYMLSGFWTLPFAANMMRNVKRNLTNPVISNDQMGGGQWSNQGRIVWWRLWPSVWTIFFSRRHNWKFMDRWIQSCAQLGSYSVFFLQYWPLKLNSHFSRGSFSRLTFKWGGEPV